MRAVRTIKHGKCILFALAVLVVLAPGKDDRGPKQLKKRRAVDVKGFATDPQGFSGSNWLIRRFQDENSFWHAQLEANGAVVKEFAPAVQYEDWLRFLLWPANPGGRGSVILFVLRYGGGAHGPEYLDIVDVRNGFKTLFEADASFNFRRVEDLDQNGWPEVVGMTRRFAGILDLSEADSPAPTVILSYDPDSRRYLCQNHRFQEDMEKGAAWFKEAFDLHKPIQGKVPYDPADPRVIQDQFAPLIRWAVEISYTGDPENAWKLLDQYLEPEAAQHVRETLQLTLASDRYYQEMMTLIAQQKSSATPQRHGD